jgi:hypothetical protein
MKGADRKEIALWAILGRSQFEGVAKPYEIKINLMKLQT